MKPPFQRPPPLTADSTSLYENELGVFNALLARAYSDFTLDDARFVIANGELFIPAVYLRYLLPMVAELAPLLAAQALDFERLARLANAATPLHPHRPIADRLRATLRAQPVRARPMSSYLDVPEPRDAAYPAGHGEARLLATLFDLQEASSENEDLLASEEPSLQMTVLNMSRGILDGGWQLKNATARPLWDLELTLARLERMKSSTDAMVALAARFVLGEVERSSLPSCGDPTCKAHAGEANAPPSVT